MCSWTQGSPFPLHPWAPGQLGVIEHHGNFVHAELDRLDRGTGGIAGYDIDKAGVLAGSSTTTSFNVTGLAPSTTYEMTVKARDAAGNAITQLRAPDHTRTPT